LDGRGVGNASPLNQRRVVREHFQAVEFVGGSVARVVVVREKTRKVWVGKVLVAKGAIDVVGAKIGQLDAVGKTAFGEERVFADVVEKNPLTAAMKKLGVLHGDGAVQIARTVIHDHDGFVFAVALAEESFDALKENLVSLEVEEMGGGIRVEMALVDDHAEEVHAMLGELGIVEFGEARALVVGKSVEEWTARRAFLRIAQQGGFYLAIHDVGHDALLAAERLTQLEFVVGDFFLDLLPRALVEADGGEHINVILDEDRAVRADKFYVRIAVAGVVDVKKIHGAWW